METLLRINIITQRVKLIRNFTLLIKSAAPKRQVTMGTCTIMVFRYSRSRSHKLNEVSESAVPPDGASKMTNCPDMLKRERWNKPFFGPRFLHTCPSKTVLAMYGHPSKTIVPGTNLSISANDGQASIPHNTRLTTQPACQRASPPLANLPLQMSARQSVSGRAATR